jgi:hypothetical protein
MGHEALVGAPTKTQSYETAIGRLAGSLAWGDHCIYIGNGAGLNSGTSSSSSLPNNIFIGQQTGSQNKGINNIFLGEKTGISNIGNNNIFIGKNANGDNSVSHNSNNCIFIGENAGYLNIYDNNVLIGSQSGKTLGTTSGYSGISNTFIGTNAGANQDYGDDNVLVGKDAGIALSYGRENVIIGKGKPSGGGPGGAQLYGAAQGMVLIGNDADAESPSISSGILGAVYNSGAIGYKSFVDEDNTIVLGMNSSGTKTAVCIGFNGPLSSGITPVLTPRGMLYVNGACYNTGGIWGTSDAKLKTNVEAIKTSLDYLKVLNPVSYYFKPSEKYNFPVELQYGFIAQELKQVFPNLVRGTDDGIHTVNYLGLIPILTKAMQEQQLIIEENKLENDKLKEELKSLENKLNNQAKLIENKLNNEVISLEDKIKEISLSLNKLNSCCELNKLDKTSTDTKNFSTVTIDNVARLDQNKPNPFSKETYIDYFIPANSVASKIEILDQTGKKILTFNIFSFGEGRLIVKNGNLSDGIYNYQLVINNKIVATHKMQIINN